jgi:3-oxoacyl-[acyl-carrier protein] reductase
VSQTLRKTALVTGSSRGIGRAVALRLAKAGWDVVVHGRKAGADAEATAALCRALGAAARLVCFDVADRAAALAALEADIAAHGAYDGVVVNAGITRDAPFPGMSGDDWDLVLRTDLDGFYNVLRPLVMPMLQLRRGGRIVAIASVSGLLGNRGQANYAAAKAGVIAACRSLALELAKRAVTVNAVAPGLIETDMTADGVPPEAMALVPLRRMGTADEVASLVAYLFSDDAGYITRQVFAVDGGLSA